MTFTVREARLADLPAPVLYGILRLRSEVFVVEQRCVYLDPDGRDAEATTRHLWIEHEGEVVACLRLLPEESGSSIGRVVTAPAHRRRGLGGALVRAAVSSAPRPVSIHAQAHLTAWYAGFAFVPCGGEFLEDGIPHLPMVLR